MLLLREASSSNINALLSAYSSSTMPPSALLPSISLRFRVMNYNVKQTLWFMGEWDHDRRLKELLIALNEMELGERPDVIIFNEIFTQKAYDEVGQQLRLLYPHQTNVIDCSKSTNGWTTVEGCDSQWRQFFISGGVQIISRHLIAEVHGLVFQNAASYDKFSNKGAVLAKIMVPWDGGRRPVWVMGTHLQADGTGPFNDVREKQMLQFTTWIDRAIERQISKKDPIIIAGDLNVEFKKGSGDFYEMKRLTKMSINFTALNALEDGGSLSAKTSWFARADCYHYGWPLDYDDTLDYIGFRKDCKNPVYAPKQMALKLKAQREWYWRYMRGWWNLPGKGKTYSTGYYKDISDHYPVLADFHF